MLLSLPMNEDLSYYTSERFIHDDIVREARGGLMSLYDIWATLSRIPSFAIAWPSVRIHYKGTQTERPVTKPLTNPKTKQEELRLFAKTTKAYALLLVEEREKAVVVILETPHGTVLWTVPIEDHGNVRVLGDAIEEAGGARLGLIKQISAPEARAG